MVATTFWVKVIPLITWRGQDGRVFLYCSICDELIGYVLVLLVRSDGVLDGVRKV